MSVTPPPEGKDPDTMAARTMGSGNFDPLPNDVSLASKQPAHSETIPGVVQDTSAEEESLDCEQLSRIEGFLDPDQLTLIDEFYYSAQAPDSRLADGVPGPDQAIHPSPPSTPPLPTEHAHQDTPDEAPAMASEKSIAMASVKSTAMASEEPPATASEESPAMASEELARTTRALGTDRPTYGALTEGINPNLPSTGVRRVYHGGFMQLHQAHPVLIRPGIFYGRPIAWILSHDCSNCYDTVDCTPDENANRIGGNTNRRPDVDGSSAKPVTLQTPITGRFPLQRTSKSSESTLNSASHTGAAAQHVMALNQSRRASSACAETMDCSPEGNGNHTADNVQPNQDNSTDLVTARSPVRAEPPMQDCSAGSQSSASAASDTETASRRPSVPNQPTNNASKGSTVLTRRRRGYNTFRQTAPSGNFVIPDVSPELHWTLPEIICFHPNLATKSYRVTERFLNNGMTPRLHAELERYYRHIPETATNFRNSILKAYDESVKGGPDKAHVDRKRKLKTWPGPPKDWDHENISMTGLGMPKMKTHNISRPEPVAIPFESLAENVKRFPVGADAGDLTNAVRFCVEDKKKHPNEESFYFPNDLDALLQHIGPIEVTKAHSDGAALERHMKRMAAGEGEDKEHPEGHSGDSDKENAHPESFADLSLNDRRSSMDQTMDTDPDVPAPRDSVSTSAENGQTSAEEEHQQPHSDTQTRRSSYDHGNGGNEQQLHSDTQRRRGSYDDGNGGNEQQPHSGTQTRRGSYDNGNVHNDQQAQCPTCGHDRRQLSGPQQAHGSQHGQAPQLHALQQQHHRGRQGYVIQHPQGHQQSMGAMHGPPILQPYGLQQIQGPRQSMGPTQGLPTLQPYGFQQMYGPHQPYGVQYPHGFPQPYGPVQLPRGPPGFYPQPAYPSLLPHPTNQPRNIRKRPRHMNRKPDTEKDLSYAKSANDTLQQTRYNLRQQVPDSDAETNSDEDHQSKKRKEGQS